MDSESSGESGSDESETKLGDGFWEGFGVQQGKFMWYNYIGSTC